MRLSPHPGVSVYICRQCIPEGGHLPRQWTQDGVPVEVTELPCSGKTDVQYLFHAIEAGAQGLLVVACPAGECRLAQGNYRAEVRVRMVQRFLAEIGMEPERVALLHYASGGDLETLVRDAVKQFCALGASPMAGQLRDRLLNSDNKSLGIREKETELSSLSLNCPEDML